MVLRSQERAQASKRKLERLNRKMNFESHAFKEIIIHFELLKVQINEKCLDESVLLYRK